MWHFLLFFNVFALTRNFSISIADHPECTKPLVPFVLTSYTGAFFFFKWWDLLIFILFNTQHSTHPTHKILVKPYLFSLSVFLKSNVLLHFLRASAYTPSSTILWPSFRKTVQKLLSLQFSAATSLLSL